MVIHLLVIVENVALICKVMKSLQCVVKKRDVVLLTKYRILMDSFALTKMPIIYAQLMKLVVKLLKLVKY